MNTSPDHHTHGGLPELLDLDAAVFAASLHKIYADLSRLADGPVRTILDVGAGTGAGTFGLLQHFEDAHAVAIDASADMLEHLRHRAEQLGLAERITTLQVDLDEAAPEIDPVDLGWASASLHHLADPDRSLSQLAAVIRPGGLLAVAELTGPPRFVADDSPAGAAEARAHGLLIADRAADMPTMGSDWGARLTRAGLEIELHREITTDTDAADSADLGQYAAGTLTRVREEVGDRLTTTELAAFDTLLDGGRDDVRHRADLHVRTERSLWIARRPGP